MRAGIRWRIWTAWPMSHCDQDLSMAAAAAFAVLEKSRNKCFQCDERLK